jgi:ribosomal protein S18 acetylase RimI-like enzyme
MTVTIRRASVEDLGIIHDIRRDAILGIESDGLGISDRQAWADRRSPDFYAERVAAGEVVLAISREAIVGWGSSSGDCITGIYICSSSGRMGVGRTIMSILEADIVNRGYERAKLESSPNALGFYTKLGYTSGGLSKDDDAVPMQKPLRMSDPQPRAV